MRTPHLDIFMAGHWPATCANCWVSGQTFHLTHHIRVVESKWNRQNLIFLQSNGDLYSQRMSPMPHRSGEKGPERASAWARKFPVNNWLSRKINSAESLRWSLALCKLLRRQVLQVQEGEAGESRGEVLFLSFSSYFQGAGPPALKINCGPSTANLWSDLSPQKPVNHDKMNLRQKVWKSGFD